MVIHPQIGTTILKESRQLQEYCSILQIVYFQNVDYKFHPAFQLSSSVSLLTDDPKYQWGNKLSRALMIIDFI